MRQLQATRVMMDGSSVFLTGAPGAGKTFVLNHFVRQAEKKRKKVAITASTGIAATHIGGTTIHSWSGLGIRDQLNDYDKRWLADNDRLRKRYQGTDILVIDEISMLHGARLDMINEACKLLRENDVPFGGLQVILVGDLFQLPPVSRDTTEVDFAHTSDAWQELNPKICYLTEQHRQSSDDTLLDLLEAMRRGDVNELHEAAIRDRLAKEPDGTNATTRLFAHNADVDTINNSHLQAIDSESKVYSMQTKGAKAKIEQLIKSVLVPEQLELKNGAEVMFVANDFASGFVNGSRGKITGFRDSFPVVELASSGREIKVEPHTWSLQEDGKIRAEATQLPLRLAWAITIHKSQGMSLDAAEIDLSKSFTPGMGYVALSRVRSLEGLYLRGINRMALQMHPAIYEFDELLRNHSELLADETDDWQEENTPEQATEDSLEEIDEQLFQELRKWRTDRSRTEQVPPYVIAHDKLLKAIAAHPPATSEQLLALPGMGPARLEKYGEGILQLSSPYVASPEKSEERSVDATPLTKAEIPDIASHREATKTQYSKAYTRWQTEEDELLLQLARDNTYLSKVCETLERQPSAVWARLLQLLNNEKTN
jgi:GTPase SAR1 family protein